MALRDIIVIDEEKCDGCGQCVNACAEGAIRIVDGKARLVSEIYCDGLGACIGHCPQDAITIEKRQAAEFDEEATKKYLEKSAKKEAKPAEGFVCPGMMAKALDEKQKSAVLDSSDGVEVSSALGNWPVQLKLIPPNAPYLAGADILVAADCAAFAMGDFHRQFMSGRKVVIGCPKLDDGSLYVEKLAEMIRVNKLASLTVVHMQVPCCSGLTRIVGQAVKMIGVDMEFEDVTVGIEGEIVGREKMRV